MINLKNKNLLKKIGQQAFRKVFSDERVLTKNREALAEAMKNLARANAKKYGLSAEEVTQIIESMPRADYGALERVRLWGRFGSRAPRDPNASFVYEMTPLSQQWANWWSGNVELAREAAMTVARKQYVAGHRLHAKTLAQAAKKMNYRSTGVNLDDMKGSARRILNQEVSEYISRKLSDQPIEGIGQSLYPKMDKVMPLSVEKHIDAKLEELTTYAKIEGTRRIHKQGPKVAQAIRRRVYPYFRFLERATDEITIDTRLRKYLKKQLRSRYGPRMRENSQIRRNLEKDIF